MSYFPTVDENISVFGEQVIAGRSHDVSVAFNYNIPARDVTTLLTGTGTAIYDQNTLKMTPGTGIGFSQVESIQKAAYRPGSEGFGMFTAAFENGGEAGLDQGIGIFDVEDGFFVGYKGTNFGITYRKGSSDTDVAEGSFNGDDISWLDKTKLNIYMIRYGWLGIAPIRYYVYKGSEDKWVLMHKVDLSNSQTLPHVNTPILPICAFQERTAGTGTASVLRSASWRAGVVHSPAERDFHRHFSDYNTKTGVTTALTNIFTLNNKTTFASLTNKVYAVLESLSAASDGTKPVEIRVVKNATLGGTPSYADIDTNNSVMEIDTAGTTVTNGTDVFVTFLGKSESKVINLLPFDYIWQPGESLTFAGRATSGTSDISFSVNWGEVF